MNRSDRTRFQTAGIPRQSIVGHGTSELLISEGTGDTPDVNMKLRSLSSKAGAHPYPPSCRPWRSRSGGREPFSMHGPRS